MKQLSLVTVAVFATAFSVAAQNCSGTPQARVFSNRADFGGSFYYALGNYFFDLDSEVPVTVNSMLHWSYDQGAGNPIVPNQVGATGTVNVYTCPTTRIGNEALAPTAPGSPWTLLGTGTLTIFASPTESPIVFTPPLAFPAGPVGVAMEFLPTTTGPAPGIVHCLGVSPNPGLPVSDQFLTLTNDGIQGVSWTGGAQDSPNLRIDYTPAANAAQYLERGDGCYFRPQAFYEDFPAGATAPDLANTGLQMLPLGPNYIVVSSSNVIVPSTSPSITTSAPGASSSAGTWDDALSTPQPLPFTFTYPGGSTSTITISSNGHVYLDAVTSNSFETCGASYGSILPFRDQAPRIAPYYVDLDVTAGGSIHYDVDPANQFVRITWDQVPEWPPTATVNTIQLTLEASGQVFIAYGALGNTSVANMNNAIAGFTPGFGARLGPAIDISASLPLTTGDGAIPAVLSMDARPVLGTSPNIITSNVPSGILLQVLVVGDTVLPAPIDLTVIGMPGCTLSINAIVFLTNTISPSGTFIQPFMIPNNPAFLNFQLVLQSAQLSPGANAFGFLMSNGLCVRLGTI